jgi:hypothetical protein
MIKPRFSIRVNPGNRDTIPVRILRSGHGCSHGHIWGAHTMRATVMKHAAMLFSLVLFGCSPTYILKSNVQSCFDTLKVALVPLVNITGNYKEDKTGARIADYLQNNIAVKLRAASCFDKIYACQFKGEPEYLFDSIKIKDGYFKTIKPNVAKSEVDCKCDVVLIIYNVNIDTMTQGLVFQDVSAVTTSLNFYAEYVYWDAAFKNAMACGEINKDYSSTFPFITRKNWDKLTAKIVRELLVEGNYSKKK